MNNFNDEPPYSEVLKVLDSIPLEAWSEEPIEEPVYELEFDFPSLAEFDRRQFERLAEKSTAKLTKEHKQPRKLWFNPDKGVFE
jgi:hypothetical protein